MDADQICGGALIQNKGRGSLAACHPVLKPWTQEFHGKLKRMRSSRWERVRASFSLSTEAVDNSVDFSTYPLQKTLPYCIFITLVKK